MREKNNRCRQSHLLLSIVLFERAIFSKGGCIVSPMSGLVFACITPHGSLIIPLLGEKGAEKGLATRTAMEDLGRRMAATKPETLVIVTPHGHRIDGNFSLLNNRRVQG